MDMQPGTQGLLSGKKFTIKISKGDKKFGLHHFVTRCYYTEIADVKSVTWFLEVPDYIELKPGTWGVKVLKSSML